MSFEITYWDAQGQRTRLSTPEEDAQREADITAAQQQAVKDANAAIIAQLEAIDQKSIRPMREGDTSRVQFLAAQAAALRAQLVK
jgi:hypothetical protein